MRFGHKKEWEALERAICIIRAVASSRAQLAFLVCPLGSSHPPPHLGAFFGEGVFYAYAQLSRAIRGKRGGNRVEVKTSLAGGFGGTRQSSLSPKRLCDDLQIWETPSASISKLTGPFVETSHYNIIPLFG